MLLLSNGNTRHAVANSDGAANFFRYKCWTLLVMLLLSGVYNGCFWQWSHCKSVRYKCFGVDVVDGNGPNGNAINAAAYQGQCLKFLPKSCQCWCCCSQRLCYKSCCWQRRMMSILSLQIMSLSSLLLKSFTWTLWSHCKSVRYKSFWCWCCWWKWFKWKRL
jgi:hypothetical protein